jgi:hypothetical protein
MPLFLKTSQVLVSLPPIRVGVGQIAPAVIRPARQFVEVGQIVGRDAQSAQGQPGQGRDTE